MNPDHRGMRVASHPSSHFPEPTPSRLPMTSPKTPTLRPHRCERPMVSSNRSSGNLARLIVGISMIRGLHHHPFQHRSLCRTTRSSLPTINLTFPTFRRQKTYRKPIAQWTSLRRPLLRATSGWSKITGTDSATIVDAVTPPTSYARRCASVKRSA